MHKSIIKDVPVADLKPYEKNYLKHDKNVEFIKNSLGTFGYIKPSVIVDENNVLLCGHGTLQAIKSLGWETVPEVVKITGLTDVQKSGYRIADNTTAKDAEIDIDNLQFELDIIDNEYSMEDFGLVVDYSTIEDAEADMPELATGEKSPFQQLTFTLADEQAEKIKEAIAEVKKSEYYKHLEMFANENSNGNALYGVIMEWYQQKI